MAPRTAPGRSSASRVQSSSQQAGRNPRRTATRPSTSRTSTTATNDIGRRLTGYALRFAVNRVVEQRRHRTNNDSNHQNSAGAHDSGSALGHAVTNALLEELIQEVIEFIVRHNFFMGGNNNSKSNNGGQGQQDPAAAAPGSNAQQAGDRQRGEPPPLISQHSSHSPTEERRRRRHRRRSEAMMHSLDRLSEELEATHDATVRVLGKVNNAENKDEHEAQEPNTDSNNKEVNELLRTNLDNLRRATTRCMARVESVRRCHYHYHPYGSSSSRRASRQRRPAGRSFHLSRSGSAMTDG